LICQLFTNISIFLGKTFTSGGVTPNISPSGLRVFSGKVSTVKYFPLYAVV